MFKYIKYFSYIAFNWNIKIAWNIIVQEIRGEKKYGIDTTGADELKKLEDKGIDISHATIYMPVSYTVLDEVFGALASENQQSATGIPGIKLHVQNFNHFLDIGCGRGRALCVAAHYGFPKLTGIDFSKELCDQAKANLFITQKKIPAVQYNIINNDAFYYAIPADADCIFLFNPFDEIILSGVVNNMLESLKQYPRTMTIIYVNPMHKELITRAGFKEVFYSKRMKYLEVAVMRGHG